MLALIFDTETSGLMDHKQPADAPGQPRVCSIAAALVDESGLVKRRMHRLFNGAGWSADVIRKAEGPEGGFAINGLSRKLMEEQGLPAKDVLAEFDSLVDECHGIASFGLAFDQKMIRAEQRIAGRSDRYGERPTWCVQTAARPMCKLPPTDKMMASNFKTFKQPTLTEAYKILVGLDLPHAHDAEADLEATIALFSLQRDILTWRAQVSKIKGE